MTVREFMKDVKDKNYICIRVPVLKEDGSFLRYEPFRDADILWPDIGGIDKTLFDRKIVKWFVNPDRIIVFDTVKGE